MTDIFSREETELAVFGYVRRSFKRTFIPPDISKLIQKFWDDTNYYVLKGTEFEAFLSNKSHSFVHTQQVDAALQLASFKLTLYNNSKLSNQTKWILQMIDNKTDKNGFFPICLVYFEIFCEEINYYYKDIRTFHSKRDTKTWKHHSLYLNRINQLPKYKRNKNREKEVTFGVFVQLISKKYRTKPAPSETRCIYSRVPNARFNDYHKKIMMQNEVKYKWVNIDNANECGFSPSFDHGNWCLKYVNKEKIYLKLLRVHGLLEKLIIKCMFTVKTKQGEIFSNTKEITMNCEDLKWIQLQYLYGQILAEFCVEIKILKAFKMTENEISMIDERYWYVYGIQIKKEIKKESKKKRVKFNIDDKKQVNVKKKRNIRRVKFKAIVVKKVTAKKQKTILKTEENDKQMDKSSNKRGTNWRFRKREKIKYIDKKVKKSPK